MKRFFDLEDANQSMPMDKNNYNDLCAHFYLHGVYTVDAYRTKVPKIGRFAHWDNVTPVVRIIMVVPRHKLKALENAVTTPPLQCYIRGRWSHNIFTAVHAAFGRVIPMGTKHKPWVVFEEDAEGKRGSSPLVVSFTVPTRLLTDIEPMEDLKVCFALRSTTGTVRFMAELGLELTFFSASLLDESQVHILPEQSLPPRNPREAQTAASSLSVLGKSSLSNQIGQIGNATVALDEQCELVASLAVRLSIESEDAKLRFQSGCTPQIIQVSPCVMRVTVENHLQDLVYPFPVIGSQCKLRLARKSLYIEVHINLDEVLTFVAVP